MSEELEVLKTVTQRLNKANMPYMVSGSIAANYYTLPRMTRDIDIVIELKYADIDKFVDLFQEGFYVDKVMIKEEVLRKGMFNLIHDKYVIKIDFIVRKDSEFQNIAFSRRKKVLIENSQMWFISVEDLVLAKLFWAKDSHSEMQLKDVRKDTSEAMGIRFQNMVMGRLPAERLSMGCSMYDTAKEIAKSAILNQNPGITSQRMKEEIFLRFYGMEFSEAAKEKISIALRRIRG